MDSILNNVENILQVFTVALFLFLIGLFLIYAGGIYLSRKTVSTIESHVGPSVASEHLRKTSRRYKQHLKAASLFYYLFLPLPIIVTLLLSGFFIYLLDRFQVISSASLGVILVFTIVLISAILKSLRIRRASIPETYRLKSPEAPELHRICKDMAKKIGTPSIDAIYLDQGSAISVFESGSLIDHFIGRTKRCLCIGIASLNNLSISQLEAILAHEFGHLCNQDTAGGSFALFARHSIITATDIMVSDLMNRWYNPSWIYISIFRKLFFRISQGAARLQELLADELAARVFGPDIFAESLLRFVENQVAFSLTSQIELMNALNEKREPENIYQLDVPQYWPDDVTYSVGLVFMTIAPPKGIDSPQALIDHLNARELTAETDRYDSHPALKDRIKWLKKMPSNRITVDPTGAESLIPEITVYQEQFSRLRFEALVAEKEYLTDVAYEERMRQRA